MVQFIIKGTDYAPDGSVTDTNLEALVESAVIQNLDRSTFAAGAKIVTVSASEPAGATAGELWYDSTNALLRVNDGSSNWISISPAHEFILTAQANTSIGSPVVQDTGNASSVTTTTTAMSKEVLGIATEAISSAPADCRIQTSGLGNVKCVTADAVSVGDYLYTSTTAGEALASAVLADGAFGRAVTAKSAASATLVTAVLFAGVAEVSEPTLGTGTTPRVFKAGNQAITGGSDEEITWDSTHSFTTTKTNESVMLSIGGLSIENGITICAIKIGLNGFSFPGDQIAFDGVDYGDSTHGGLRSYESADSHPFDITIPITVPSAGTHRIYTYINASSAMTVKSEPGGTDRGGRAFMMIWKMA